jgi:putative two-component system protein, hydrogenase maturation factor HypX/HoxX
MTDTTKCPDCGGPAQVRERFVLESTDGPLKHARTSCARGHHFVLGLEALTRPPRQPVRGDGLLRIMLLCSAFNGLTQRAWIELRAAGHEVTVQHAGDDEALRAAVAAIRPDVLICPFLRDRVPEDVWRSYLTIVIHPGPPGDRGPSSLDWAIMSAEPVWGVTALQAIDEMDAGPIWASRTFPVDTEPPRKSALYNGSVTDIAAALIHEVVAKVAYPGFAPQSLDYTRAGLRGRLRPAARQSDRSFSWSDPTERVLRRIRAADGAPGVHTQLCGMPVTVFDAHPARIHPPRAGLPGTVVGRRHGAVLVRTGDGGIWVGQLRSRADTDRVGHKLPATTVLAEHLADVPDTDDPGGYQEISYRRDGPVGLLDFRFYNGAMSTRQCRRLRTALRYAAAQDTRVLLLRGGHPFSNGIHLGVIDASPSPAAEAWDNIHAIDDVCEDIITCLNQLVVCSIAGNAGAGGVMLALGADHVVVRAAAVLNPHYRTMGLYGSEYWTYVLPQRVGQQQARSLTTDCLPISAAQAVRIGLADRTLPGDPHVFEPTVERLAHRLARAEDYQSLLSHKRDRRAADEQCKPLRAYRHEELAEMSNDIFQDQHGFAAARHRFVTKQHHTPAGTTTAR